jgi:trimethylamine--corrinoid protein Co-methyltransferase
MIRGRTWDILDRNEQQRLDEAAMRLLEKTGALIEHDGIRKKLTDAGGRIDGQSRRCLLPERLVRAALANFGTSSVAGEYVGPAKFDPQVRTCHYGSFPQFLEWPECRRRPATREDVRNMAKMAHMLPEFEGSGQALTASDVDARIEPVWNAAERMSLSDKRPGGGEVIYPQHVKHLVRLGEIATGKAGDTSMFAHCNFSVAPLIFGRRDLACIIEKAKYKCHHVPGTMPISGISGPVTLAGTAALGLAELYAGWVIGYLLDPSLPAAGIVGSGSLDMRTVAACFGSPEAHLQDMAVKLVCRDLHGITVHPCLDYMDCKKPGIDAAFQKMSTLRAWPINGGRIGIGAGLLAGGECYSPVQHLLDLDMIKSWERFAAGFEVNDATLAVDVTDRVARKRGATFLDTDHTLENYGGEQWYPRWLDRRAWQGDEAEAAAERKMLDEIDRYWKDAVARYRKPDLDEKKLSEAREVLKAVEREMEGAEMVI